VGISRSEVLDQLAYLADELEAQQSVLGVIPKVLWDARPPTDPRSLRDMYSAMLARECGEYRVAMGLETVPTPDAGDPGTLLSALAERRRATVAALRGRHLSEDVLKAGYGITQQDADSLREVGLRLHETSMGSPKVRQL